MQKHTGGNPPFAYNWKDSELVIEPTEAPIYALMFELFLVHQRKRTVAKLLNEKGFRTRAGKEFTYSTVARLLQNPIAKGIRRFKATSKNEKGEIIHSWIEESVEPIVSVELWDQVNTIIKEQDGKQSRKPKQDIFIGKVNCGCGSTMNLLSKSDLYACTDCRTSISSDDLLQIFENRLQHIPIPSRELIEKSLGNSIGNTSNLSSTIKSKILKIERDIEKLFELHSSGAITAKTFKSRHQRLEDQLTNLKTEEEENPENKSQKSKNFYDYWKFLDSENRYTFSDTLIHSITVSDKKVTFSLFSLFS